MDKEAAKAAKAAKRAAAKGLQPGEQAPAGPAAAAQPKEGTGKDKGARPAVGAGASGAAGKTAPAQTGGTKVADTSAATKADAASDPLQLFLHLDLPSHSSQLSHSSNRSTANIHPSIIRLALQYAEFKIVGANARCIAMLEALKDVS